jgi:hypothetical protein
MLLDADAKSVAINIPDNKGYTPLHHLAYKVRSPHQDEVENRGRDRDRDRDVEIPSSNNLILELLERPEVDVTSISIEKKHTAFVPKKKPPKKKPHLKLTHTDGY